MLGLTVLVAVLVLGARFWLLPNVDTWRPEIARYVGQASGTDVQIEKIEGEWSGWRPRFTFSGVRVREPGVPKSPGLDLATVTAELQWQTFWVKEPRFAYLSLDGLDLKLARSPSNHLLVAGQEMDLSRAESPAQLGDHPVLQWLRKQNQVSVQNATVHWLDLKREAPELTFTDVSLTLRNPVGHHQIVLTATPMSGLSGKLTVKADMDPTLFVAAEAQGDEEQGTIYAELDNVQLARWAPWIAVDGMQGAMSARGWAYLSRGKIGDVRVDARARDLSWQDEHGTRVIAGQTRLALSGAAGLLPQWKLPVRRDDAVKNVEFDVQMQDVSVALAQWFDGPAWHASSIDAQGAMSRATEAGASFSVTRATVVNDDMQAALSGRWRTDATDPLGALDLKVDFDHAQINAIYRYLPKVIDPEVREWLARGLVSGQARNATLEVKGPLSQFPFDAPHEQGRFMVQGDLNDATLDYLPLWRELGHTKAWPQIEKINGRFVIDRTALTIEAREGARVKGKGVDEIAVGPVTAHIPDMAHEAQLLLDGTTIGPAPAYLRVLRQSPLGAMIDGAMDSASGVGRLTVPLVLSVPLTHAEDAAVRGEVVFSDANVRLSPQIPAISNINGRLVFTENDVRAVDLRAKWLGGPVTASGALGSVAKGIDIVGSAQASALQAWAQPGQPGLDRMRGAFDYAGRIAYGRNKSVQIDVSSDLKGLALDLPAPFGKPAGQVLPVTGSWRPDVAGTATRGAARSPGAMLSVTLGENARMQFERLANSRAADPLFARGAIAIDRPLALPESGLRIDANLPDVDAEQWRNLIDEFDKPTPSVTARTPAPPASAQSALIGPARALSLTTPELTSGQFKLEDVTLSARTTGADHTAGWEAQLASRQAEGRIEWRNGTGDSAGGAAAGRVQARLSRLSLEASDAPESERKRAAQAATDHAVEDLSTMPAVDLAVDAFTVYGKRLGKLEFVGTNLGSGEQWRLDKLAISNPAARLSATGMWTARGSDRGLMAQVQVDVSDLGELISRLGQSDVVRAGQGSISGKFSWRNSPWTHNPEDIDGDVRVDLRAGRFVQVDSGTVRLLELLSLQSLERIATFRADPTGPSKAGFPFDEIKSRLRVDRGILRVDDYAIEGPVARIKLVGESDMINRTWDINASVVPNLDASGAALATGFAVNPLFGVGAMVTQWVLKKPLQAAFTQRYHVSGPWDAPTVQSLDATDTSNHLESLESGGGIRPASARKNERGFGTLRPEAPHIEH